MLPAINVPEGKRWIAISDRIKARADRKSDLEGQAVPVTSAATESARHELVKAESTIVNQQAILSRLIDALAAEEQEIARVERRLAAIKEDIKHNQDSRTLRNLGSRKNSDLNRGSCPVCHQSVADSLIPLAPHQAVMSLDQNIEFLQEQSRTFHGVLEQSKRVASARHLQVHAARNEISKLREHVQHLRETLVSDGRSPSLAAVYERVELERDLKQDMRFNDSFVQATGKFAQLSEEWKSIQIEFENLPSDDLSPDDHQKLKLWGISIQSQLRDYGFRSLSTTELELSPHTYRPEIEGFELQTTISASDLIRTIWAYQNGMLEVAREAPTNHPGMLLFDEPRQQSTRDVSFVQLLKRVSQAANFNQQVILFTSEEKFRLNSHLANLRHDLQQIDGRVLQKLR
ncbi:hypothetical protein [Variovorax sp. E3]|uniref:hypothetical protein n=1 Tax=Variovorax sp. E3 TaxID=1914993 RepID=UPI0018DC741B|nr:hypothetical protein [Variovorax sp. E3]